MLNRKLTVTKDRLTVSVSWSKVKWIYSHRVGQEDFACNELMYKWWVCVRTNKGKVIPLAFCRNEREADDIRNVLHIAWDRRKMYERFKAKVNNEQ
jgi:hypothetical protein